MNQPPQPEEEKQAAAPNLPRRNPFASHLGNSHRHSNQNNNDYVPEYERELDHKIQNRQIQQEVINLDSQKLSFESLKCIVCFELPDSPFDCEQCGTIICKSCFGQLNERKCPYCQKALPRRFKANMCLNKIINEFEIECPQECGARVKKGNMAIHLKECPEKKFECVECGAMLKKMEFRYHISREHGDTML
jgi:hypothetical protein